MKKYDIDNASGLLTFLRFLFAFIPVTVIACPHNYKKIALYFFISIVVCLIGGIKCRSLNVDRNLIHKKLIILDVFIVLILCVSFWHEFSSTHVLDSFANKINVSGKDIIKSIIFICGIAAVPGIDFIMKVVLIPLLVRLRKLLNFWRIEKTSINSLLMGGFELIQLNFSITQSVHSVFTGNFFVFMCNILIIVSVNILLKCIVRKKEIMMVISGVFFTVWSIGNYYVFMYHGNPILPSEISNLNTALNVVSTYKISFNIVTFVILLFLPMELCYVVFYEKVFNNRTVQSMSVREEKTKKNVWMKKSVIVPAISGIYVVIVIIICWKTDIRAWSITECVKNYGYMITVVDDFIKTTNPVTKPKDYNLSMLEDVFEEKKIGYKFDLKNQYPDIILILNETFCDISKYVDIDADVDYMKNYYNIEGAFYGNCVVPEIGGGTNNSEFELLTSNSMYLMNIQSPFNYWGTFHSESIVSYLKELGYITTAMHCENSDNYARRYVYPELGFDNIIFRDDFKYTNYNGNRYWLDADNYHDLEDLYDENSPVPQFMYILTFQNHGGYEQNGKEYDTVHVRNEFGDLTDDVDEYLSSIQLTANAFHELTDYFKNLQRPVLICMVGDHAPAFISDLPIEIEMDVLEKEVAQRTVPYIMWSNYSIDLECMPEYASMVDLIPILLKSSSIPISTYHKTILKMNQIVPIRTRNGICMNNKGKFFIYEEELQQCDCLKLYYNMEYNQLKGEKEYMEELFVPLSAVSGGSIRQ